MTRVDVWRYTAYLILALLLAVSIWAVRQERKLYRATEYNRLYRARWEKLPVYVNFATGGISCGATNCHTLTGHITFPYGTVELAEVVRAIADHNRQHPVE